MTYQTMDERFGRDARDRSGELALPGLTGATAALETFYCAFNRPDLALFRTVWVEHDLIRLKNPLGGVLEGIDSIVNLYDGIFNGPADVWVEFSDIVVYDLGDAVLFSGREHGEFTRDDTTIPLEIRTTRVMHYTNRRWGQVHHHGSISDAELLRNYQAAVRGR